MNGSSNLEEADLKPFALCPICLRKLGFYLGFEGQEQQRYWELKSLFKMMNMKDPDGNFRREINLFEKILSKIGQMRADGRC
mmetsp:Transcript_21836/g.33810  ORF Transcript_21836/g.33810 Transcript_21836/m.33810 type:complete len:82 (-) Transcript_21836:473-718(-)